MLRPQNFRTFVYFGTCLGIRHTCRPVLVKPAHLQLQLRGTLESDQRTKVTSSPYPHTRAGRGHWFRAGKPKGNQQTRTLPVWADELDKWHFPSWNFIRKRRKEKKRETVQTEKRPWEVSKGVITDQNDKGWESRTNQHIIQTPPQKKQNKKQNRFKDLHKRWIQEWVSGLTQFLSLFTYKF